MALIYDLVDPQELLGFIRSLPFDRFTLNRWLPDNNIRDIEYRFQRGRLSDQDAAEYRAWDTEAGIAARQGTERVSGELPPISRKIRLGEEERLRLESLRSGDQSGIIDAIYNDAANMTRAVQARVELARGEALSTGELVINENGMQATVEYGVPAAHQVAAALVWSDPAAEVVQELRAWMEIYLDTNGVAPGWIQTSTTVVSNLLRNNEIRQLAGTLAGTPALVTPQTVSTVFSAFGLPPILTYDTTVRVNGTATRTIAEDVLLLLPPAGERLGQTLFGVTAEALELQQEGKIVSNQAPGIVAVVEKTFDPVATWTKAAGIGLPVLGNPELVLQAVVL